MTDTVISPSGSQGQWEVMDKNDYKIVGHIEQSGNRFAVKPTVGSVLDGINQGPYSSKEGAMSAIGAHSHGNCSLLS